MSGSVHTIYFFLLMLASEVLASDLWIWSGLGEVLSLREGERPCEKKTTVTVCITTKRTAPSMPAGLVLCRLLQYPRYPANATFTFFKV